MVLDQFCLAVMAVYDAVRISSHPKKQILTSLRYSSSKNSTVLACGVALVVSRVVRRWNQTGQKFAGEPDIARILLSYNRVLWLLAIATYLFAISKCHWRSPSRFSQVVAFSSNTLTLLAAMAFKVAFTSADAPELLKGLPFAVQVQSMLQHYGLPYLARCVFSGVSLSILIPMVLSRGSNAKTHPINGIYGPSHSHKD